MMKPSEAFGGSCRKLKLSEAEGAVSAGMVVAYPPGRPVLVPGEEITGEAVTLIASLIGHGANIRGLDDDMRIKVL